MKRWFALTCPVCGFRHSPKKFKPAMNSILYPVQIVTGGGRAKGFRVEKYLPWSTLPNLRQTNVWNSILCLYNRLGAAYDFFYETLGFLSPKIRTLIERLQRSYSGSYLRSPFPEYEKIYMSTGSLQYTEPYLQDDYPEAYALLINTPFFGVA